VKSTEQIYEGKDQISLILSSTICIISTLSCDSSTSKPPTDQTRMNCIHAGIKYQANEVAFSISPQFHPSSIYHASILPLILILILILVSTSCILCTSPRALCDMRESRLTRTIPNSALECKEKESKFQIEHDTCLDMCVMCVLG
jgi:hypothetical protein